MYFSSLFVKQDLRIWSIFHPIRLYKYARRLVSFSFKILRFLTPLCVGAVIEKERVVAGDQVLLEPEDPTDPLHVGTVVYMYEGLQVSPWSCWSPRIPLIRLIRSMSVLWSICTRDLRSVPGPLPGTDLTVLFTQEYRQDINQFLLLQCCGAVTFSGGSGLLRFRSRLRLRLQAKKGGSGS